MTDWRTEVRVELARQKKTRKMLAITAGITPAMVSGIITGKKKANIFFAHACEAELGISADMIMRETEEALFRKRLGKRLDELHALREGEVR